MVPSYFMCVFLNLFQHKKGVYSETYKSLQHIYKNS